MRTRACLLAVAALIAAPHLIQAQQGSGEAPAAQNQQRPAIQPSPELLALQYGVQTKFGVRLDFSKLQLAESPFGGVYRAKDGRQFVEMEGLSQIANSLNLVAEFRSMLPFAEAQKLVAQGALVIYRTWVSWKYKVDFIEIPHPANARTLNTSLKRTQGKGCYVAPCGIVVLTQPDRYWDPARGTVRLTDQAAAELQGRLSAEFKAIRRQYEAVVIYGARQLATIPNEGKETVTVDGKEVKPEDKDKKDKP